MKIENILTGRTEAHLDRFQGVLVHHEIIEDLEKIQTAALDAGFELAIASGFRSFERQLHIWNQKANGKRKLLDHHENEIDPQTLSSKELLFAILRWSALPGASRHHWGCDLDIYDAKCSSVEDVKLTQAEANTTFKDFHCWLDVNLSSYNFYRPFEQDFGGVAPEPWHISYAPIAKPFASQLTKEIITTTIENSEILLKREILDHIDPIFEQFIASS